MTNTVSKAEKERQKLVQERCQFYLTELLKDDDNKYCVDCDAKGPRWASWNLGVFLCIRCAGIHRNLGVHISKVKSVNLDAWTPEQLGFLQQMGNSKARAVYEANLPDNFRRPQTDSSLEAFIRSKYEHRKYIAKEWVQPPTPPPAFDVEEERKKEKERKRQKPVTIVRNPTAGSDVQTGNSSVPRPPSNPAGTVISADKIPVKGSSPSSSSPSNGSAKNGEDDLLGLNFGSTPASSGLISPLDENPFDAFGSTAASNDFKKASLGDEETDFFNQKVPEKKLDKDSILKIFDSNTMIPPNNSFFNPVAAPSVFASSGVPIIPGNSLPNNNLFSDSQGIQMIPQSNIPMTPASSATNPFLTSSPAAVSGVSVFSQGNNVNNNNMSQVQNQLGSLNMNSGLMSGWMSGSTASSSSLSTSNVGMTGINSSLGQSSLDKINPFAGSTCNASSSSLNIAAASKPTQNLFADFAQFPATSSLNPSTVSSTSNGINWGLSTPSSSSLNPIQATSTSSLPSDLFQ